MVAGKRSSQTKKPNQKARSPKSMMHNPFQSYQSDPTLGAYTGFASPFGVPFTPMQASGINPALNPLAAIQGLSSCASAGNPQLGQQGVPNYVGLNPLQVPVLSNPWVTTGLQNPLLTAGLQNPWFTTALQNQFIPTAGLPFGLQPYAPYQQSAAFAHHVPPFGQISPFGQQISPYGQQGLPYGQPGLPYQQQASLYGQLGSPLAPQSWIGQAGQFGGGQQYGQIHPLLAQLGARQFLTPGISPWTGF
jgi:hypothetical protein